MNRYKKTIFSHAIFLAATLFSCLPPAALAQNGNFEKVDGENRAAPSLSATHGQVWRVHDISRYTARINNTKKPEMPILDWIFMETGFETWHSEIPAMLTVTPTEVRVFHTPEIQKKVADVVAKFISTDPNRHEFKIQLFTIGSPNWRQKIVRELSPIPSFSVGSQAWVLGAEDLKAVTEMFEAQPGFSRHSTQSARIVNGQPYVCGLGRTRTYTRNVYVRPGIGKKPEADDVIFEDGFSFELMPLLSVDGGLIDAQLKCQIDHLERFLPLQIPIAGDFGKREDQKISLPVMGQYRFRERYQWNSQKILLVSLGLTPIPVPSGNESRPGLPFLGGDSRVEMLVMIQYRGVDN